MPQMGALGMYEDDMRIPGTGMGDSAYPTLLHEEQPSATPKRPPVKVAPQGAAPGSGGGVQPGGPTPGEAPPWGDADPKMFVQKAAEKARKANKERMEEARKLTSDIDVEGIYQQITGQLGEPDTKLNKDEKRMFLLELGTRMAVMGAVAGPIGVIGGALTGFDMARDRKSEKEAKHEQERERLEGEAEGTIERAVAQQELDTVEQETAIGDIGIENEFIDDAASLAMKSMQGYLTGAQAERAMRPDLDLQTDAQGNLISVDAQAASARPVLGPDGKPVQGTGRGTTAFSEKYAAYIRQNPDDHEGALEYASGRADRSLTEWRQVRAGIARELEGTPEWRRARSVPEREKLIRDYAQRNYGLSAPEGGGGALPGNDQPAPGGGGRRTYTGPDGKVWSHADVQRTAQSRGLTVEEVIERAQLQ